MFGKVNLLHLIGKLVPDDSDIGDIMRRVFGLVAVSVAVGVLIAGIVFAGALWGEYQTKLILATANPGRENYYRGVFDLCLANVPAKEWCQGMTQHAMDNEWFETESVGWSWSDYK